MTTDTQCAETPMSDHVASFWRYLETETVRILLDLKRTIGTDAPNGPIVYWDSSSLPDDVAKALVVERADLINALREAQSALNGAPQTVGLQSQIEDALAKAGHFPQPCQPVCEYNGGDIPPI